MYILTTYIYMYTFIITYIHLDIHTYIRIRKFTFIYV